MAENPFAKYSSNGPENPFAKYQNQTNENFPRKQVLQVQPTATEPSALTQLGMGTRDVLQGLAAFPSALYDVAALPVQAGIAARNAITGQSGGYLPSGSEYVRRGLEATGLPESPPSLGKAIRQGAAAAAGGAGLATALPASTGALEAVRAGLAAAPAAQIAGGAGAGAGSELAREAGGGPVAQTLAGLAGGIAGGRMATTAPKRVVPTTEDLYASANKAYGIADNSGAMFSPTSYASFVDDAVKMANSNGLDEQLTSDSYRALTRMQETAASGAPVSLQEIDKLRKIIGAAAGAAKEADRKMALRLRDSLDNYVSDASANSLVGGDKDAVAALNNARSFYARAAKSADIEALMERADLSASAKSAAIKNEFRLMARNPKKMRLFSETEQNAIKDIVKGRPSTNALQMLGSLGATSANKMLSGAAGYAIGGPVGAVGVPAAEMAAQAIANRVATRQAERVAELMRSGRPTPTAFQNLLDLSPLFLPGASIGTTGVIDRGGLLGQ